MRFSGTIPRVERRAKNVGRLTRIAPEIPVTNMAASLRYYTERLGFEIAAMLPDSDYAILERDDVALHLFEAQAGTHTPVAIHAFASGLDELHAELTKRGALVTQDIVRQPWGNREFRVTDLAGNIIKFTEPTA